MLTSAKLSQNDEGAFSVSELLSNIDLNKKRRSNCLSYLSRTIADKEYETRRVKEQLAIYEHQYRKLFSQYTELLRTVTTGGLCPSCGRVTGKLSARRDEIASCGSRQNRLPEVSEKNFDRLVEENAKLKLAVQKIKDENGVDVERIIEVQEYENVISSLREDILRLKLELQELKYINSILTKKDKSSLLEKNQQLQKRVSLLEHTVKSKENIIEQLMNVLKKCDSQPDEESSCAASGSQPHTSENVTSVKGDDMRNETLRAYENKISQLEKEVMELKLSLAREAEKKTNLEENYRDLLSFVDTLHAERMHEPVECPESVHQLIKEKKSLQDVINVLRHDLQKVLDEKTLLLEQCKTFQEDFLQERKKNKEEVEKLQKKVKRLEAENSQKKSSHSTFNLPSTSDSGYASGASDISSQSSVRNRKLICDRCEQSFCQDDLKKFEEHKRKCQAD